MNKFFDDKPGDQEPEKVKVGEVEFTPEELQDLVGAGQRLKEIEEKQGQPVDEILTSWGKRGEVIGGLKKEKEELAKELDKYKNPPPQEQVDREKLKEQVVSEAREFGLLTKDEAHKMMEELYETRRSGEKILARTNKVLREAKKEGRPVIATEKLLEFMADPSNPKDPQNAYNILFSKELDEWKQKRLESIKKPGMITETKSTAGSKGPEFKVPTNKEDLRNALRVAIRGEGGLQ